MQNQILCARYQNPRDETAKEVTERKREIPRIKLNLLNCAANQNLKFESPNSGRKHHASLEQHEPDIASLQQFKPSLFREIQKLSSSNSGIWSWGKEISELEKKKLSLIGKDTRRKYFANCNET